MDFKDEYKNEMQNISPTEEQCERIRSEVMRKLQEKTPVKRKKPLYLRIAAVSGAAVCAAAVAIVIYAGTHSAFHFSGSNNMLASPAADGATGGAMNEGHSSDFSISDANSFTIDCAPNSTKNDSSHYTLPSHDYSQDSSAPGNETPPTGGIPVNPSTGGDTGNEPPPMGGVSVNPYLTFSEDKGSCVVTIDGATHTYYISDDHIDGLSSEYKAVVADSNLDTVLFVQFDENIMTVHFNDGNLFGVYIK